MRSILKRVLLPIVKAIVLHPFFFTKNGRIRFFIFKLLWATGYNGLLYVHMREKYLVNSRDLWLGGLVYSYGIQDFDKFELAIDVLKKNGYEKGRFDVIVDAGANIGTICIPALCRGYAERALTIEANPEVSRLLKTNIVLNDLDDRVQVVEKALGSQDNESLWLEISDENHGDNWIASSKGGTCSDAATQNKVEVLTVTLDSLISESPESMLIWMDLQGYEGIALKGASRLLKTHVPMVIEFWPGGMKRSQSFESLKSAVRGYHKFVDLKHPEISHPIDDLDKLYDSLGEGDEFTDIVLM